jgi:hypothetical protein
MKKIILCLLVLCAVLSLTACSKCLVYYACCNIGHDYWKGQENASCQGAMGDSMYQIAIMDAQKHDKEVHGGIGAAQICKEYKRQKP